MTDRPPQDPVDDVFGRLHDDEGEADLVEQPHAAAAGESELDEHRIRQIATLRRALYRSRSYAIIAMCAAAVVAVQLAMMTFSSLRRGHPITGSAMLLAALACIAVTIHFYRRAIALHHEAKQTQLVPPREIPDFSTLSDGSQRWKNLEDVQ